MNFQDKAIKFLKEIANISDHIDTTTAAEKIKSNIYFKGPNVWILAFSIIIASVGLNVNSIPVIIGAMLISPLMGPIFGIGLGLGTNNATLLKDGLKNLLVMVAISIFVSFIYFIISPLTLLNPTEIMSRTTPSLYDVLIALFGGAAGIFEQSRKEKGTVISGVAIATALMPPLCSAGYGLAKLNFAIFAGAFYLFIINGVFIILATYFIVRLFKFPEAQFIDETTAKKTRKLITAIIILVIIPSIWSATVIIKNNNFEKRVTDFISQNKELPKTYIYNYKIDTKNKRKVTLFLTGETLSPDERKLLFNSAENFGLKEEQILIKEHSLSNESKDSEKLVLGIYERTEAEINKRETQIQSLEKELQLFKNTEIPYSQIAREITSQYPEIGEMYITRGVHIKDTVANNCILVVPQTEKPVDEATIKRINKWLKIRVNDTTATVLYPR